MLIHIHSTEQYHHLFPYLHGFLHKKDKTKLHIFIEFNDNNCNQVQLYVETGLLGT